MPAFPFLYLVAIALIILANGFFATVEFALVSARRTWLQHRAAQGDSRAETALHLIGNLNAVVSGTQLGLTMTSLALGWVGEITLAGPSVMQSYYKQDALTAATLLNGWLYT